MRATSTCPDICVLKQLVLGLLSPEEIGDLQEHLSHCADCLVAVEALPSEDPFTRALQARPSTPRPDDAAVEHLMERLRDSGPSAPRLSLVPPPQELIPPPQGPTARFFQQLIRPLPMMKTKAARPIGHQTMKPRIISAIQAGRPNSSSFATIGMMTSV